MNKRQKILKLFNEAEWFDSLDGPAKCITAEDFKSAGLCHSIEYQEKYCDVIYARRILQSLGYKVLIGQAFHVIDYSAENKDAQQYK